MIITQHFNLKLYNTFKFDAYAENFIRFYDEETLIEIIKKKFKPIRIIGGGSNILLTQDIQGYVLKNEIKGIKILEEDEEYVTVEAGAGEIWHQFVMWSLSHGLGGLENLSLIPGTVGAAPMQNIGAYGVEQESCFVKLSAIHHKDGAKIYFDKAACRFGYRESIFKNMAKDQYYITHVQYRLKKRNHQLNFDYGAIRDVLTQKNIKTPTIRDVSDAVIEIRRSKLPDPAKIGNAGSFFKNPVISTIEYNNIKATNPDIPSFYISENMVKIPAGWLIEKAGFKGLILGHIGVHKDQALVLVHYGGGKGLDIKNLAYEIQQTISEKFDITIQPEVNIW